MIHEDGDEEDLDGEEVQKARKFFRNRFTSSEGYVPGHGCVESQSPFSQIGKRIRRLRISGESYTDGTVMSYSAPTKNGPALW